MTFHRSSGGLPLMVSILIGLATACAATSVRRAQVTPLDAPPPSVEPGPGSGSSNAPSGVFAPEGWAPPQAGWMYVLDVNNLQTQSQVLLVDPGSGVKGAIRLGHAPDMALSPDGKYLYLISLQEGHEILKMVDTSNGSTRTSVEVPKRSRYTVPPPYSLLTVSEDGTRVYINVSDQPAPGQAHFGIATFDTQKGQMLPSRAALEGCMFARLRSVAGNRDVSAACPNLRSVRFLTVQDGGEDTSQSEIQVDQGGGSVSPSAPSSSTGGQGTRSGTLIGYSEVGTTGTLFTATSEGRLVEVDGRGKRLRRTSSGSPGQGKAFAIGGLAASTSQLYVGIKSVDDQYASEVAVFNVSTLTMGSRIRMRLPFSTLSVSPDGSRLYAASPENHDVLLVDLGSPDNQQSLSAGNTPALVIPVP
jgi:hypothetical protein